MSRRCKLQKEYYQANGNYKGNGKYCDKYVSWLEEQILALRMHDVVGQSEQLFCECPNNFEIYQETKIYHLSCNKEVKVIRTE